MYISSLYKQESKPLGSIPLAENKVIRHPDDPKLPNQYRFEIISKLCLKYYVFVLVYINNNMYINMSHILVYTQHSKCDTLTHV